MQKYETPNKNQKAIIKKRGLDPDDYVAIRQLNYCLYILHRRNKTVKIIDKRS